jgi:hypothetical protein
MNAFYISILTKKLLIAFGIVKFGVICTYFWPFLKGKCYLEAEGLKSMRSEEKLSFGRVA